MSYSHSSHTSPLAPHAFSLFSMPQSPRETHAMFEDLVSIFRPAAAADPRRVLIPSNEQEKNLKGSRSTPSFKKTWRKLFGLDSSEPEFEFITPEKKIYIPPSEDELDSLDGSLVDEELDSLGDSSVDEEFGTLGKNLFEKPSTLGSVDDNKLSDVALLEEPIIVVTRASSECDDC